MTGKTLSITVEAAITEVTCPHGKKRILHAQLNGHVTCLASDCIECDPICDCESWETCEDCDEWREDRAAEENDE